MASVQDNTLFVDTLFNVKEKQYRGAVTVVISCSIAALINLGAALSIFKV